MLPCHEAALFLKPLPFPSLDSLVLDHASRCELGTSLNFGTHSAEPLALKRGCKMEFRMTAFTHISFSFDRFVFM